MADLTRQISGVSFRVTGGARLENFEEHVDSPQAIDDNTIRTSNLQATDVLPSINLKISPVDAVNLRLGALSVRQSPRVP